MKVYILHVILFLLQLYLYYSMSSHRGTESASSNRSARWACRAALLASAKLEQERCNLELAELELSQRRRRYEINRQLREAEAEDEALAAVHVECMTKMKMSLLLLQGSIV